MTQQLEGPENFISWKKAMIWSLGFKKKLGFIYAKIEKSKNTNDLDRNVIVFFPMDN